jgi:UDP-N-acetylmuramyl pentapeptide phosphotransferase/UDP-N-acetylglucosamine-1-phosphate transferase
VPLSVSFLHAVPLASALVAYAIIAWMLGPYGARLPLDRPNKRSLHAAPVPRGGGLAIMLATFGAGIALGVSATLLGCLLVLALLSFLDDRYALPTKLRLLVHALAAAAWIAFELPQSPLWLLPLLFLGVVWMTNLYNFMDGIDGLAGGMAVIGFGAYALALWSAGNFELALFSASVAAAAAAFLCFNFNPARIFMGDVGSIPLGFLAALLGLIGWRDGAWPLWFPLLVFSPFIVDATFTLILRLARSERVWEAHREHYYQRLVRMGLGHRNTCFLEYVLMVACAAAALAAREAPAALQFGTVATSGVIYLALAAWIEVRWARRCRAQ